MRRAACFLPGLLLVGAMYWSMAFGLGGTSLAWLLATDGADDDELELVAPRPSVSDLRANATSCWMLAAEEPVSGEVQRWRLSRCADDRGESASASAPESTAGVVYDVLR